MAGDTHYEVLGIAPGAEATAIRRAYVAKARMFHPDFHADATPEVRAHAEAQMRAINDAWAVLGSTGARSKYDRDLRNSGRMTDSGPATTSAPSPGAVAPERTSGSAPPRWLTMLPMFCLFMAVACFAVGMVTGLPALLAGAIGSALLGGVMFVIVPMVALKRSKQGSGPTGRTASA